ncbi:zinc ribbon domain-containing protein [Alicyclobacillus fastidiosus]
MVGYHGRKYRYYRCRNHRLHMCRAKMVRCDVMEPVIIGFLDQMSQESLSRGTPPASVETASAKMRDVERGRSLLEARKRRLWDAYERESITLEELSERLKRIEQEERALNDQEVGTNQEKTNDEPSRPSIAEVTQRLSVGWESLQPLQRKELARALIERIDVDREHIQVQLKRM